MAAENQRISHDQDGAAQTLLVDGLPPCTITVTVDGTWHLMAQLAADEQAASSAAVTYPDTLCQRAQHALGLAGIGSRIAPDQSAIGVYIPTSPALYGATPLMLEGRALLSWVSRAPSESIRALIAAAIEGMRQSTSRGIPPP